VGVVNARSRYRWSRAAPRLFWSRRCAGAAFSFAPGGTKWCPLVINVIREDEWEVYSGHDHGGRPLDDGACLPSLEENLSRI
jgi:hypothetical protein